MSSKKRCCQCRIPAISIFILCALFCAMVACGSALGMYFFTIGIVDDSVKREGLNQANAIGASVSAKFSSVEKTRNVTIGDIYARRGDMVGMAAPALRVYLNSTYSYGFLSEAASDRVQGVEVACMLPEGIADNADATGFARVSVFYEIQKSGGRIFTRSLTEDDGTSIRDTFVDFQNSSSGQVLQLQASSAGAQAGFEGNNDTFVYSYQGDYSSSDYFYFDAYVGPDGLGYFYATSYRYFFAGSRLCEVSAYQLVDSWYGIISDALRDAADTRLAIVDGATQYVVASSFESEYSRMTNCYADFAAFDADGGACIRKTYTDLPNKLLRELVSAVYQSSWATIDEVVPTQVLKRKVGGEEYYLVVKQLGNINYLRPMLVWGRPVNAVISDLRQTAIIIVVCSAVGIMLAMLLVAGCTAIWLLRPMKKLEQKMERLTRMDANISTSNEGEEDSDEDTMFENAHASAYKKEMKDMTPGDHDAMEVGSHTHSNSNYESTFKPSSVQLRSRRRGDSFIKEVDSLQSHFRAMGKALHSFSKYVPKDVVNELISSGQVATSGMRERRLTVMFVDIAGFTTMCEEISNAGVISELLTRFFSANTKRLQAHGATIDKFIGDCIMCFWGAPLRVDNPNFRAICGGLDLQRTARELNESFMNYGVALSVRVGAHTGRALVGNIGSDDRINYTVMGDVVNATSRLEGVNKQFFTTFMASEAVLAGCKRQGAFVTRYVGDVALRGKQVKLASHQICGTSAHTIEDVVVETEQEGGGELTKVSSVRAGTLTLAEGYSSVAPYCFIDETVASACDLFSRCTMQDHHATLADFETSGVLNDMSSFTPPSSPSNSLRKDVEVPDVGDLVGLDTKLQALLGPSLYMACCREDGTVIDDPRDDSAFLAMRHPNQQEKAILVSLRKDLKRRIKAKTRGHHIADSE